MNKNEEATEIRFTEIKRPITVQEFAEIKKCKSLEDLSKELSKELSR